MLFNPKACYTIIHTIQIRVPIKDHFKTIRNTNYNKMPLFKDDEMWLIINPNNYPVKRSDGICDLLTFQATLDTILKQYKITEYKLHRVDVAVNLTLDYESCYKLNAYLCNLDAVRVNATNNYFSNDFKMNHRSLVVRKKHYTSEFYNKKVESNSCDFANTRLEFRYTDVEGLTFESAVYHTISNIDGMLRAKTIKETNHKLINDIAMQYHKEKDMGTITTFTEFICKYSDFIYNQKILYGVYDNCMPGTKSSWYAKFKETHQIDMYSNEDMASYTAMLKNSLYKFLDSSALIY